MYTRVTTNIRAKSNKLEAQEIVDKPTLTVHTYEEFKNSKYNVSTYQQKFCLIVLKLVAQTFWKGPQSCYHLF